MNTYTAKLNFLRMAPRKVRLVANLIKNLSVNEARAQLDYINKRSAVPLKKLLLSAISNARSRDLNVNLQNLFIKEIFVDPGPVLKRMLPRARGSASPLMRRMSHVTLTLGVKNNNLNRYTFIVKSKKKISTDDQKKKSKEHKEKDIEQKTLALDTQEIKTKKPRIFSRKAT